MVGRSGRLHGLVLLAALLLAVALPARAATAERTEERTAIDPSGLTLVRPAADRRAARTALGWVPTPDEAGAVLERLRPGSSAADEAGGDYWRRNLVRRVLSDQKYLLTSWAPQEARRPALYLPLIAGVAAATGSSRSNPGFDLRASESIAGWGMANASGPATALSRLGDGGPGLALVGGTYLLARYRGNTRLARATSLSAEAMANAAIWSTTLKAVTRRARPNQVIGGEFLVTDPNVEGTSFPSGHAMGAFSVATVMAHEYRDRRWVAWVAYGTAGLIGTSRVVLSRHYVSDVVVGSLLGHSLGRMVVARQSGAESAGLLDRFAPIVEPEGQRYGLSYGRSW